MKQPKTKFIDSLVQEKLFKNVWNRNMYSKVNQILTTEKRCMASTTFKTWQ